MHTFVIGADHRGFSLKESLKDTLRKEGCEFTDISESLDPNDDYPGIAQLVAKQVLRHDHVQGLLICGSGHGMDIAANRFRGVRAVVIRAPDEAAAAREHNHANVLVLGSDHTSPEKAAAILHAWIHAHPSYAERHTRRVHALDQLA